MPLPQSSGREYERIGSEMHAWAPRHGACGRRLRVVQARAAVDCLSMTSLTTNGQAGTVSVLLRAWGQGDLRARDDLASLVYRELRRRAGAHLQRERNDHTLQPTALVHEAYMRLVGQERVAWRNRAHFFAIASQMMRRILVDHARERRAAKRPGAGVKVMLDDQIGAAAPRECELIDLDQALTELTHIDPRQGQVVELRYFGGLSEQEVAEVLSISRATVTREWQTARAWLYRRITARPVRTAL